MKLTFPIPSGVRIRETYGIEMMGSNTWLQDNKKLYAKFFFKFAKLNGKIVVSKLCCKHNI